MNNFILREARANDQDALCEVTLAAYEQYATIMPSVAWKGYQQNILETLANIAPAEQIVAELDGAVVGTVLLYPAGFGFDASDDSTPPMEFPEVRLLAVAPSARGKGIGEALMRECIARARRAQVAALSLHTNEMMQVAMRMYERMGFVRVPELDFEPAPGIVIKGYRYSMV